MAEEATGDTRPGGKALLARAVPLSDHPSDERTDRGVGGWLTASSVGRW